MQSPRLWQHGSASWCRAPPVHTWHEHDRPEHTRGRRVGTAGPAQPLLNPSPPGVAAAPCVKQELLLQGRQRMMKPGRNLSWQRGGCWREPLGACAPPAPPPLPSHGAGGSGRPVWRIGACLAPRGSTGVPDMPQELYVHTPASPRAVRGPGKGAGLRPVKLALVPARWCLVAVQGWGGGRGGGCRGCGQ